MLSQPQDLLGSAFCGRGPVYTHGIVGLVVNKSVHVTLQPSGSHLEMTLHLNIQIHTSQLLSQVLGLYCKYMYVSAYMCTLMLRTGPHCHKAGWKRVVNVHTCHMHCPSNIEWNCSVSCRCTRRHRWTILRGVLLATTRMCTHVHTHTYSHTHTQIICGSSCALK